MSDEKNSSENENDKEVGAAEGLYDNDGEAGKKTSDKPDESDKEKEGTNEDKKTSETGEDSETSETGEDGEGGEDSDSSETKKETDEVSAKDLKSEIFDEESLEEVAKKANELGLDSKQAKEFLKFSEEVIEGVKEQEAAEHKQVKDQWLKDTKSDPDIGGDKLAQNAEYSKKAIDSFGTDALKEILNETELGNHPEIVRVFAKIGKEISDDKRVVGESKTGSDNEEFTIAEGLYGKD